METKGNKVVVDNVANLSDELFAVKYYDTLAAEAIRTLRTNITLRDFDKKIKVINIMSVTEAQGKSTIITNLAASFSQLNKKVLLIDCDLHMPTMHHKLNLKNKYGLVDVVSNFKLFDDCVIHYMSNFDVLTAGTTIPFISEFIQSSALHNFILDKREKYDYIFIDCPPIVPISDAFIISKYTDGAILVVAAGESDKRVLQQAKERLDDLDVNVLGVVLNRAEMSKHHYGYNYNKRKK